MTEITGKSQAEFLALLAARAERENPRENGDYLGADGLLYCGKCNTPKQCIPAPNVPEFRPRCLCKCAAEKIEAEKRAREAAERQKEIERNRSEGITDTKLLQYNFANDKYPESKASQRLRKYCENHKQAIENNLGLLLWGGCGVGKSFYAGCVANMLIDSGIKVLCTTFPKILNDLFSVPDKNAYINNIVSYPFLIIDDLGTERGTEYALEQLFTLIDERYKSNLPTIITTNQNPRDMANVQAIEYKRIYDRIAEMCTPFYVEGNGQRQAVAKNKAGILADILGG